MYIHTYTSLDISGDNYGILHIGQVTDVLRHSILNKTKKPA
jgi:hypothetical protein